MKNKNITTYLKLPFQFDVKALQEDLNTISSKQWIPQLYKMNYNGEWTSIALVSKGGTTDNFAFASATEDVKETVLLKNCLYFKKVLDTFECPLISVRLLKLCAHSEIKPHTDYKLGYENHNFRLHIPIVTNSQIKFILDGEKLEMLPGECWYTNVNFLHSVSNKSSEDRIHLVIDGERNAWTDQLFFSLAPKESFNLQDDQLLRERKKRMLEELKFLNAPGAKELINKLEKELQNL